MAKEYVPIFFDWLDVTQDLTAEEKGNLIDAVVAYASGKEYEHLLTGGCKIAFRFLKGQVDRNNAISEARSKAGSNKPEQTPTNEIKQEQSETNFPKEKEKEKEKEKDKDKESVREKKPLARFTPPTINEVKAYCRERNNTVDAERFVDFYTAKGWKVGNQSMKDWKAAVRTWERDNSPPVKAVPKVNAQNYGQRDYSHEDEDALRRWAKMG